MNKCCVTISTVLLVASKGIGSQAVLVQLSSRADPLNISPRTSQLQKQDLVATGLFPMKAIHDRPMQCSCILENRSSW